MRVFLVRQSGPLHPFARPPDACGCGSGTFSSYRARTLDRLGLPSAVDKTPDEVVEGPALVLADDVFVTRRALRFFLSATRAERAPVRLCLPPSRLLELTLPLQDVPIDDAGRAAFDVAFVPAGQSARPSELFALDNTSWRAPDYREILVDVPVPTHLLGGGGDARGEGFTFPLTTMVALRVRHWVHVLRVGHLMPQIELIEGAQDRPFTSLLKALPLLRLSRASTMRALRRGFSLRGRDVDVHPTATVEASVLHDGVSIGAHAYIVGSVLGPGVTVEQRAHVEQSSLGPRTFVSKNSSLSACVAFGDTDVCVNGVQACVVAERCGLTSFARPLDMIPGAEVRVRDGEELREVGELVCGVAFGTDVFVGAGVEIAPGRAIPPGVRIVGDPSSSLRTIPDDIAPGTVAYVKNGTLEPL